MIIHEPMTLQRSWPQTLSLKGKCKLLSVKLVNLGVLGEDRGPRSDGKKRVPNASRSPSDAMDPG